MGKKYKNKEWLEAKYVDEQLSTVEISEILKTTPGTIYRWLKRLGVRVRSKHEAQIDEEKRYMNKDWLKSKYIDAEMIMREIGNLCGVSDVTIGYWIKKNDIPTREAKSIADKVETNCDYCGSPIKKFPSNFKNDKHHFCSKQCLGKWRSENRNGSKAPRWNGGYNEYRARRRKTNGSWVINRQKTLERDNYSCEFCKTENNLAVHHILPVHNGGTNEVGNLITVCRDCHKSIEKNYRHRINND